MPSASSASTQASRPLRFGRFVIMDKAGAGAMGTVYAAYDPTLDRRVALKVLRSRTVGRHQERIRREALAMARVSHRNVVQVFEVGEHEGRLFIAMEFVEGLTLTAWQAETRPWAEVARMYVEVARGLAAAHDAGLVHRDFKPDNVLIDTDGRPRIIDFGLARATTLDESLPDVPEAEPPDDGSSDDWAHELRASGEVPLAGSNELLAHSLTRTGRVMGTPAYMAPELMNSKPPTPRSDQFAFAVAFYEALCGQPPFPRDSLIGLKLAVTRGDVQPPPADRDLPGPLGQIVRRALSPDPDDRFESMTDLIDALDRLIADDELVDWRPRVLVFALLALGLVVMMLGRGSTDAPETPADMLVAELVFGGFVLLAMFIFRHGLRASMLHRRGVAWVVMMTPAKISMPLVGLVYGVAPSAIRAFDTVLISAMSAVVVFLIHRPLWPALAVAMLCLAGMLIEPAWTGTLHSVATMALAFMVFWRALSTARRVRAGSARPPDQKSA